MHGRMHTARTYGRLYPGWRLPFALTLVGLEQRFNVLSESYVNAGLRTLLLRSRRTEYPDPNESTLLTLPLSASTLRSLLVAQGDATTDKNARLLTIATNIQVDKNTTIIKSGAEFEDPSEDESKTLLRQFEEPLEEESGDNFKSQSMNPSTKRAGDMNTKNTSYKASKTPSEVTSDASNSVEIMQGRPLVLKENANFIANAAEILHLHVISLDNNTVMHRTQRVTHSLKWLHNAEAGELAAHEGTSVIDVNQIDSEITREVDDEGCVLIAARGVVVRIKAISNTL